MRKLCDLKVFRLLNQLTPIRSVQTDLIRFKLSKINFMSSTRIRHLHPINTRCHGRLRATIPIETNIFFIFCFFILLSLCPTFSNPNLCSSFVSTVIQGRPSWPANVRTSWHTIALTESLPGEQLKVFSSDPDEDRLDRSAIPVRPMCCRPDRFELLSNRFNLSMTYTPSVLLVCNQILLRCQQKSGG
jgi:hypothetical protein